MNLLEINPHSGFVIIGNYKNIYILNYNKKKRKKEKIFGKKKLLISLNGNINQIKMLTFKKKENLKDINFYDKENNIFYTDFPEEEKIKGKIFFII